MIKIFKYFIVKVKKSKFHEEEQLLKFLQS